MICAYAGQIMEDGKIVAVYKDGTSDAGMYYFHNDHLGSPWLITNASGNEVQRLNYDAWGRRRDALNWYNYSSLPEMKMLDVPTPSLKVEPSAIGAMDDKLSDISLNTTASGENPQAFTALIKMLLYRKT